MPHTVLQNTYMGRIMNLNRGCSNDAVKAQRLCRAVFHENITKFGNWAGYKKMVVQGKVDKTSCRALKEAEVFKMIVGWYLFCNLNERECLNKKGIRKRNLLVDGLRSTTKKKGNKLLDTTEISKNIVKSGQYDVSIHFKLIVGINASLLFLHLSLEFLHKFVRSVMNT